MVGLTDSDNVAEIPKTLEVVYAHLETFPPCKKRCEHWGCICESEEDDSRSNEGIEGRSRSEIDASESDLNDHAEHHSIQRHIELGVDLFPPFRAWDSAIARECPCTPRCRSRAASAAKDSEDDDGNGECERPTFVSYG